LNQTSLGVFSDEELESLKLLEANKKLLLVEEEHEWRLKSGAT
jgi:hypothetical protein